MVLQCRPVPRRQQRLQVNHSPCRCLNVRPSAPNSNSSTPACLPLRPRLEHSSVLRVRHAAVAALGRRVALAAAPAALAPCSCSVVVKLVLAAAARYSAAAHGQVSKAGAGAALHPAPHLLRGQLPPSVRPVAVRAHAPRRRAHVVAVRAGGIAPRREQLVVIASSCTILRHMRSTRCRRGGREAHLQLLVSLRGQRDAAVSLPHQHVVHEIPAPTLLFV